MGKVLRWCWPPMLAAGILVLALQGTHWGQGGTAETRATDKIVYTVLRDVANRGAELFNKQNDWAACYRVYEGGLLTVKPFLAHRPNLQKAIDDGFQNAESQGQVIERAFALRKVIDSIRDELKSAPASKDKASTDKSSTDKKLNTDKTIKDKASKDKTATDKTTKDKSTKDKSTKDKSTKDKTTKDKDKVSTKDKVTKDKDKVVTKDKVTKDKDKKAEKKIDEKKTPATNGNLSGKVTMDGKAGVSGFLTLISKTEKRSYSTAIGADGAYAFRTPIPAGTYTIIIETTPAEKGKPAPIVVPERYRNPATSGLVIEIRGGPMVSDVALKN